jgi:hypothetical protein
MPSRSVDGRGSCSRPPSDPNRVPKCRGHKHFWTRFGQVEGLEPKVCPAVGTGAPAHVARLIRDRAVDGQPHPPARSDRGSPLSSSLYPTSASEPARTGQTTSRDAVRAPDRPTSRTASPNVSGANIWGRGTPPTGPPGRNKCPQTFSSSRVRHRQSAVPALLAPALEPEQKAVQLGQVLIDPRWSRGCNSGSIDGPSRRRPRSQDL